MGIVISHQIRAVEFGAKIPADALRGLASFRPYCLGHTDHQAEDENLRGET
jgi:hypothetical protein